MDVVGNNIAVLDSVLLIYLFPIDLDSPIIDSPFLRDMNGRDTVCPVRSPEVADGKAAVPVVN